MHRAANKNWRLRLRNLASMMPRRRAAARGRLLAGVLGPGEPELGCEECFDQVDRYVELELQGRDAAAEMPLLHTHLVGCPACREEHDDLLEFTRSQQDD
jgi:hypothetical protein